jgi:hypothetical protein
MGKMALGHVYFESISDLHLSIIFLPKLHIHLTSILNYAIGPTSQKFITISTNSRGFKSDPALCWTRGKEFKVNNSVTYFRIKYPSASTPAAQKT